MVLVDTNIWLERLLEGEICRSRLLIENVAYYGQAFADCIEIRKM